MNYVCLKPWQFFHEFCSRAATNGSSLFRAVKSLPLGGDNPCLGLGRALVRLWWAILLGITCFDGCLLLSFSCLHFHHHHHHYGCHFILFQCICSYLSPWFLPFFPPRAPSPSHQGRVGMREWLHGTEEQLALNHSTAFPYRFTPSMCTAPNDSKGKSSLIFQVKSFSCFWPVCKPLWPQSWHFLSLKMNFTW